jgi:hypothetical protein
MIIGSVAGFLREESVKFLLKRYAADLLPACSHT